MKLEDIVLVRATKSHLLLNGKLRHSCYDKYLKKMDISDYNDLISTRKIRKSIYCMLWRIRKV